MEVKLKRPLVLEVAVGDQPAKTIEKLVLDLEKLTGADVDKAATEARASGGLSGLTALVLEPAFHSEMAALACGLPVEALRRLCAVDYIAVTTKVQGFLLGEA